MLKDNKDEAFDLLQLALTSPRFDADDVERIRAQVLSGLRRDSTNPTSLAGRKFLEVAFGDHPYGRSSQRHAGKRADDRRRRPEDYVAPRASPETSLRIAVVGDVEPTRSASCWTRLSAACRRRPISRRLPTSSRPSRRNAPSFRSTCRKPW